MRRGGTISISGVYAGMLDPLPMQTLFDQKQEDGVVVKVLLRP